MYIGQEEINLVYLQVSRKNVLWQRRKIISTNFMPTVAMDWNLSLSALSH